jgi:Lon protease-like protein
MGTGREDIDPAFLDGLPIFPLPNAVLLPGGLMPLHVFEPRYRDMMADCLLNDSKHIAVAQLKPGWEPTYERRPAIYDVAGIGRIAEHKRNADGTYDIVLEAVGRAHLLELEPEGLRYRRAMATWLRDRTPNSGVDSNELTALFALATEIAEIVRHALPAFQLQASREDTATLLADRIADQLVLDPAARQDLLETLDVAARVRTLTGHMAQLHMALRSAHGNGSPTVH